jgi:O-antigen ligase
MSFSDFIFGIGLSSLSGTVGLPKFPMAHNNYFDLLFSGGIIHLVSYLILMIRIPLKVIINKLKGIKINIVDRSYSMIIILLLINMLIGEATFYQPIATVSIFVTICSYDKVKREIKVQTREHMGENCKSH